MKHATICLRERRLRPLGMRIPSTLLKLKILGKVLFLLLLVAMSSCSNNDEYYERPSWLEPPIYEALQKEGHFTLYLQAVDKTLYQSVLKGSGNYTVFAPNDDAFRKFLSENSYSSVDAIPVEELTKLIGYSMVFNKFESTHLGDVLGSGEWKIGASIKKQTSYYKTIYKDDINGVEQWIVDAPSDLIIVATPYKYLPIFTSSFFSANNLTATDYNAFFPTTTFTGYNIQGGSIVGNKDLYAENGIIHEVDVVSYPLENLDEMLKKVENTVFKGILDTKVGNTYLFTNFNLGVKATELYKNLYPNVSISGVYYKNYLGLPFSMNNEYYSGKNAATTEQDGYTLLVPSNESMTQFTDELKARAKVNKLSDLSATILTYLLQAHLVDGMVWPSTFKSSQNANGEFLNAEGSNGKDFNASGVLKSSFASNGMMYNIDHVIKSKYFNTVYSEVLLNPDYKLLNSAFGLFYKTSLYEDLMKSPITGYTEENYTILLPSDELLKADGYTYDEVKSVFANSSLLGTINSDDRLKRLIRMCVFKRIKNKTIDTEIKDFKGSPSIGYGGYGYAVNDFGDMIRFKDNKLQGVGNILSGEEVTATELTDFSFNNGKVFTIDKLLQFSTRTTNPTAIDGWSDQSLYTFIGKYVAQNPEASLFKKYLDNLLYNSSDGTIAGISTSGFYTILIPQDDVITAAVADGYLPAFADIRLTDENMAKTACFLNSCFLSGMVIADDGISRFEPGNYEKLSQSTIYKVTEPSLNLISVKTYMEVTKENGIIRFKPKDITEGNTVKVQGINQAGIIRGITKSNYMGPRAVIHAVDNYLTFKVNK